MSTNPSTLARSRSRSTLGAHGGFTVVCVKEWKGAFGGWGENDDALSPAAEQPGNAAAPRIKPKNLGSLNELSVRKGDIIKVSSACNREGRNRRPVPRVARRLDSGFLDTKYPVHDPEDDQTWWVGTIVRNGKDTRTGRFPQFVVALTAELRQKTQTFRCKMCSRMQKNFTKSPVLDDFGITGQVGHVFGARDLCDTCGPKILRVVKNVAVAVLSKAKDDDKAILAALRAVARRLSRSHRGGRARRRRPRRRVLPSSAAPTARRPTWHLRASAGSPPLQEERQEGEQEEEKGGILILAANLTLASLTTGLAPRPQPRVTASALVEAAAASAASAASAAAQLRTLRSSPT